MKKVLVVVNSLFGAVILTAVISVATLLVLMFSTDIGRTEDVFGGLYFQATDGPDGTTDIQMGVADPVPVVVLFVLLTVFLVACQIVYRGLKDYRQRLIDSRTETADRDEN